MSTCCNIEYINKDKSIDIIYCHRDGYPSYITDILSHNYNTQELARELVDLGGLSHLNRRLAPSSDSHSFDTPETGVTVAYVRDRGESWEFNKPAHYKSVSEMQRRHAGFSYCYLYDSIQNTWLYRTDMDDNFKPFNDTVNESL